MYGYDVEKRLHCGTFVPELLVLEFSENWCMFELLYLGIMQNFSRGHIRSLTRKLQKYLNIAFTNNIIQIFFLITCVNKYTQKHKYI